MSKPRIRPIFRNRPKFDLGEILITPAAEDFLKSSGRTHHEFLYRHSIGDFGDIDKEDWQRNEYNIDYRGDGAIHSSYAIGDQHLWVITEGDRSATTLLMPEDY